MKAKSMRIKWVDYVKVIACMLVVLGHFFQSMTKANIMPVNNLYMWFNTTIYYFHVPLFFISSGFLYQKYSKVVDLGEWKQNIIKKAIALGIPYFVFSTLTWILKTVFSGLVNEQSEGLFNTWFLHPSSPYWYLYCLFFIFVVTPTFTDKKQAKIGMLIALTAKITVMIFSINIYVVATVLTNEIWFVMGMCISTFNVELRRKSLSGTLIGSVFIILSIVIYKYNINNLAIGFVLGIMACIAVILLIASNDKNFEQNKIINGFAKYTMPIFLMHTLFAAPTRVILIKVGLNNVLIQVIVGILISFLGPVIAAIIMKKIKWLEILIYPGKFIKTNYGGESK